MILCDPYNPRAARFHEELVSRLEEPEIEGVVIVIGGDGFMLHSVDAYGFDRVYLGLNAGHLGFLLNDVDDWDSVAARLQARDWTVHAFPLLEAHIRHTDDSETIAHAINDVYLERMSGHTAHLSMSIDDHEVVDHIAADGIICSTAIGSTAYTFSAGGPACHPSLEILTVTPICPHRPRLAPFALPATARLQIAVQASSYRPVRAVVDGREQNDVVHVEVKVSEQKVQLAYLAGHDFTNEMVRKILRPLPLER